MPGVVEFGKQITISIGLLIFLIVGTFTATMIYSELTTLESRVDKRYNRHEQEFVDLKEWQEDIEERMLNLERCEHK